MNIIIDIKNNGLNICDKLIIRIVLFNNEK